MCRPAVMFSPFSRILAAVLTTRATHRVGTSQWQQRFLRLHRSRRRRVLTLAADKDIRTKTRLRATGAHHRYGVTVLGEAIRGAFDLSDAGGADNGIHL